MNLAKSGKPPVYDGNTVAPSGLKYAMASIWFLSQTRTNVAHSASGMIGSSSTRAAQHGGTVVGLSVSL
ncbi:hypothetical protein ACVWWJ_002663 [Luteibacter sp. HA06]